MANTLTDTEKADLCDILGLNIIEVTEHLTFIDDRITSAMDARIKADIATWRNEARDKHRRVFPGARNYHVDINPEKERRAIKKRIAQWLFIDVRSLSGMGTLPRG